MTEKRAFHIGDVISVTTGKLVSLRHMDGIYDILNFMTGDNLFTHQLPRAMRECEPWLTEQFPELAAEVVPDGINSLEAVQEYLETLYPKYGETVEVAPMSPVGHTVIHPVAELKMNYPHANVIEVEVDSDD